MTKDQIIEYLYDINIKADVKIEDIADELAKLERIVRCRECKNWNTVFDRTKAEYGLCKIRTQLEATRYNDFCSRGERRDNV